MEDGLAGLITDACSEHMMSLDGVGSEVEGRTARVDAGVVPGLDHSLDGVPDNDLRQTSGWLVKDQSEVILRRRAGQRDGQRLGGGRARGQRTLERNECVGSCR